MPRARQCSASSHPIVSRHDCGGVEIPSPAGYTADMETPGGRRKTISLVIGLTVTTTVVMLMLTWIGCENHHTPAGHVGYVKSRPILGAGHCIDIQKGPTSTGWVWRQDVTNIDVRTRTYSEEMVIPTRNRLELGLKAHARIRLRPDMVRDVVEKFGGEDWYVNN